MAEDKNDILERAKARLEASQATEKEAEAVKKLREAFDKLEEIEAKRQKGLEKSIFSSKTFKEEAAELTKEIIRLQTIVDDSEALDNLTKKAESLAEKIGGLANLQKDYNETLTSSIVASLGTADGFDALTKSLKNTFDATNIAAMAIEEVITQSIALTKAQDDALVQFAKNGGNVRLYKLEVRDLERSLSFAGVTAAEAGEAFLAVNNVFTDLRNVSQSARTDIVRTTAILQELGVAGDVTASNIQYMTKVLGTSAEQASHTQRELFLLARTIDMPPEAMATAFQDAMPALSAFGSESTEVFRTLQVNARAAGMEVSDVLSIVEQFDTFDTAAQSVGRLNAILGGPFLNSLEMVTTTDPTERMRMLSDAVNDAGLAFDDMSYYQRKALADAMGMDIPQLALLMRDGFSQAVPAAQMSQDEMANLAKEAKEFQSVMDELQQAGLAIAKSLMPMVEVIKGIANGIQTLINLVPGFTDQVIPPLIVGIGLTTLAVVKLKLEMATFGPIMLVITAAMFAMSDAAPGLKLALAAVAAGVGVLIIKFGTLQMVTGGFLFVVAAIATALIALGQIIWHKSASPGMIDSVGALGDSFGGLASDLGGTAQAFGSLKGEMLNTAEAAHKLDGTKVEMQTKVSATSRASGQAYSRIRMASDQQAVASQGAQTANQVTQGNPQTNVNIKLDDSSLVKLIVKTVEEVNKFTDSGLKANSNVIQNRIA